MTVDDLIYMQLKDFKDEFRESRKEHSARMDKLDAKIDSTRQELNDRMDRLELRQDKLENKLEITRQELNARMDKLDEKIDKLSEKIDKLAGKIDSYSNHGNIMTATTIGIALGVLYVAFFK